MVGRPGMDRAGSRRDAGPRVRRKGRRVNKLELGLVLPVGAPFSDGPTARWTEIRDLAVAAEAAGFGTLWVSDELLWRGSDGQPLGWWECVAMAGAVAASTSSVKVGTWVMSALHRNP